MPFEQRAAAVETRAAAPVVIGATVLRRHLDPDVDPDVAVPADPEGNELCGS